MLNKYQMLFTRHFFISFYSCHLQLHVPCSLLCASFIPWFLILTSTPSFPSIPLSLHHTPLLSPFSLLLPSPLPPFTLLDVTLDTALLKGRVVGVIRRNWRQYAGSLDSSSKGDKLGGWVTWKLSYHIISYDVIIFSSSSTTSHTTILNHTMHTHNHSYTITSCHFISCHYMSSTLCSFPSYFLSIHSLHKFSSSLYASDRSILMTWRLIRVRYHQIAWHWQSHHDMSSI